MNGYLSKLAQHTGLGFDLGAKEVANGFSDPATVGARARDQGKVPIQLEATTLTDPAFEPVASGENFHNANAIDPARMSSLDEAAALNRSIDSSVTTINDASNRRLTTKAAFSQDLNQAAPVTKKALELAFEERLTNLEPRAGELGTRSPESATAGVRRIVQFPEELSLERNDFPRESPATPDTLIEISPRASPEETEISFGQSGFKTNQHPRHLTGPTSERELPIVEFLEEWPLTAETAARKQARASVETLASQFADPRSEPHHQSVRRQESGLEADDQELFPLVNEGGRPRAISQQSERELAVRKYMKEVRAWVGASSTEVETTLEPDHWSALEAESRHSFPFEQESDLPSVSRHKHAEDAVVHDLSLAIGNISIVIEEPKKDAPLPPAAPPSAARSPEQTASEPTSLSRYYLKPW